MTTPKILATAHFGADNRFQIDAFQTRFGGLVFFVADTSKIIGGSPKVIRQSEDIVAATAGLDTEPGISEAVELVLAAVPDGAPVFMCQRCFAPHEPEATDCPSCARPL